MGFLELEKGCFLNPVKRVGRNKNVEAPGLFRGVWGNIVHSYLGGAFKYLLFSPLPGEAFQFDEHIFGWVETTNQFSYLDVRTGSQDQKLGWVGYVTPI